MVNYGTMFAKDSYTDIDSIDLDDIHFDGWCIQEQLDYEVTEGEDRDNYEYNMNYIFLNNPKFPINWTEDQLREYYYKYQLDYIDNHLESIWVEADAEDEWELYQFYCHSDHLDLYHFGSSLPTESDEAEHYDPDYDDGIVYYENNKVDTVPIGTRIVGAFTFGEYHLTINKDQPDVVRNELYPDYNLNFDIVSNKDWISLQDIRLLEGLINDLAIRYHCIEDKMLRYNSDSMYIYLWYLSAIYIIEVYPSYALKRLIVYDTGDYIVGCKLLQVYNPDSLHPIFIVHTNAGLYILSNHCKKISCSPVASVSVQYTNTRLDVATYDHGNSFRVNMYDNKVNKIVEFTYDITKDLDAPRVAICNDVLYLTKGHNSSRDIIYRQCLKDDKSELKEYFYIQYQTIFNGRWREKDLLANIKCLIRNRHEYVFLWYKSRMYIYVDSRLYQEVMYTNHNYEFPYLLDIPVETGLSEWNHHLPCVLNDLVCQYIV